jgi:hypothetical protein
MVKHSLAELQDLKLRADEISARIAKLTPGRRWSGLEQFK